MNNSCEKNLKSRVPSYRGLGVVAAAFIFATPLTSRAGALDFVSGPSVASVDSGGGRLWRVADTDTQGTQAKKKSRHQQQTQSVNTQSGEQPSESDSSSLGTILKVLGVLWFAMFTSILMLPLFAFPKPREKRGADGHVVAQYGVPYCNFTKTDEGFFVTFRRIPLWFNSLDPANIRGSVVLSMLKIVPMLFVLPFAFFLIYFRPYRIDVTKETVALNGTKYKRADFGGFMAIQSIASRGGLDTTKHGQKIPNVVLTYSYGQARKDWGGMWPQDKAMEFVNSFNAVLKQMPMTGSEHAPSPDQLRDAARSNEF
jgi:hypothetical protein